MKTGKIPSYVPIYNQFYKDIIDGVYPVGSRLPSENELKEIYGVSRNTLRQALAILDQDGYIERFQGKGSFVRPWKREEKEHKIENWLLASALEPVTKMESEYNIGKPTAIARNRLELSGEEKVLACNMVYSTDSEPISHSFVQIPVSFLEKEKLEITTTEELHFLVNIRIYERAEKARITMQTILADEQVIPFLKVAKKTPLLYIEQLLYEGETPIARVKYYFRPEKYHVTCYQ